MGLTISHGAFDGSYGAFNRFRQIVARAIGGSFPPHERGTEQKYPLADHWYFDDENPALFSPDTHPGLLAFFRHSDCDGEIAPEVCNKLADEMEALLPKIKPLDDGGNGHILRDGGYAAVASRFIRGCRAAAGAGEPLEFH